MPSLLLTATLRPALESEVPTRLMCALWSALTIGSGDVRPRLGGRQDIQRNQVTSRSGETGTWLHVRGAGNSLRELHYILFKGINPVDLVEGRSHCLAQAAPTLHHVCDEQVRCFDIKIFFCITVEQEGSPANCCRAGCIVHTQQARRHRTPATHRAPQKRRPMRGHVSNRCRVQPRPQARLWVRTHVSVGQLLQCIETIL
jgi:hypothetical protein